jgi:hypothetical protein
MERFSHTEWWCIDLLFAHSVSHYVPMNLTYFGHMYAVVACRKFAQTICWKIFFQIFLVSFDKILSWKVLSSYVRIKLILILALIAMQSNRLLRTFRKMEFLILIFCLVYSFWGLIWNELALKLRKFFSWYFGLKWSVSLCIDGALAFAEFYRWHLLRSPIPA